MTRFVLSFFLLLPACTSSLASVTDADVRPDAPFEVAVCARQHDDVSDGQPIVVCDEAFDTPPYIRLPDDTTQDGVDTVYGGIGRPDAPSQDSFLGRDRDIPLGNPEPDWLDGETVTPLPRYASHLYRARVRDGVILDVTPVVRIEGLVFSRFLAGLVLEGVGSRHLDDGSFAFEDRDVPMRIRIDDDVEHGIAGTIENADASVTDVDGNCLPSLASLGDESPLFGREGNRMRFARYPAMHVPFDDVVVYAWSDADNLGMNMGGGLYIAPADLVRATPVTLTDASNVPHGTPTYGPSATLAVVGRDVSGGAPCTP